MRLQEGFSILALGAWLVTAVPAAAPAGAPPPAGLEGDWETVIASPERPWNFIARFHPRPGGWDGTMIVPGLAELALSDVRLEEARVRFRLPPQLGSSLFEGTLAGSAIEGRVTMRGRGIPTRLRRSLPLPAPADREEGWRQDLDFAAARLAEYDRSFSPEAREELAGALARLKTEVDTKDDAGILAGISRAVALGGNAHTRMRLDPTLQGSFTTELPIRLWWFSDGPHVVKAIPEYARALRCRVVAIEGVDISEVRRRVEELFAGNASWGDYMAPIYLVNPDILHGAGLAASSAQALFTFEEAGGARFTLAVHARPVDEKAAPEESWMDLSPLMARGDPPWETALPADRSRLPLYLRHLERAYWFEFLPETGLLYFQYNRAADEEAGPGFREFGDSLLAFVRRHPVRDVVIDLRLNSGGNLRVAQEFFGELASSKKLNRAGHLFVITGHCTFSAGLYHAAQLRQLTRAAFAGEPVGDRLDYWAEGGHIVLPNSGAVIAYSNGFHRYSTTDYPGNRPYYEELRVASLTPDLPAPMSSRDYFSGRDPALEAIEARLRPSGGGRREE